jgi:hypothetical protein
MLYGVSTEHVTLHVMGKYLKMEYWKKNLEQRDMKKEEMGGNKTA